ncbi:MAG: hypothetical protein QM755_03870 [Luteolibacter sp.]
MAILSLSACRKPPAEVTVTETRAETSNDTAPKLFATSDERFRDRGRAPSVELPRKAGSSSRPRSSAC